LNQIQKEFKSRNVFIVGVTDEQDSALIRQFTVDGTMEYHVAIDTLGDAKRQLYGPARAQGIPCAFIIGPDNTIAWQGHPMDPSFKKKVFNIHD
jgi:hypothetical protein